MAVAVMVAWLVAAVVIVAVAEWWWWLVAVVGAVEVGDSGGR